jgi:hypothetical protein
MQARKHEVRHNLTFNKENAMSRKSNSVPALLALVVLLAAASAAMSQVSTGLIQARSKARFAVVAIKWDGKVQFAKARDRVIEAVQKAVSSEKEFGRVTNVEIKSFAKTSFLAIRMEERGTLYLELVPSGGGIQEIFHIGDTNYLYCSGCKSCDLIPASLSQNTGPRCECAHDQVNPDPVGGTECSLHPVRSIRLVIERVNSELLAVGFDATDGGTSAVEPTKAVKQRDK